MTTNKNINFEKLYYYMLLIFAVSLPISKAIISIMMFLFLVLWVIELDFKRKFIQIKHSPLLISIIIFISYTAISLLWTTDMEQGIDKAFNTFYLFIVIIIATSVKQYYVQKIITWFLAGMFISEIIAYGIFFELWEFGHGTVKNPSPFMMHIDYSVFMAFTSILLLNRIISNRYQFSSKLIMFFFFLTVTGNLFFSNW